MPTYRSFNQRNRICDDHQRSREDARCARTRDSASNNQGCRGWCSAADGGTDLEYTDCAEEYPFNREKCVEFAENQLERAGSEEISAAVPAHVVKGREMICDSWDGGSDDRVILWFG